MIELDDRERDLLNAFQRGFPLTSRPFAEVAETLGVDEDAVIETARRLQASGAISRLGAVTRPNTAGASTLAARGPR
jgi:DNA-binding Lrp family transcriptional regulator